MILDEQHVKDYVNKKNYPFLLFGILLTAAFISMVFLNFFNVSIEQTWIIGGTQLLMYLMINAISCLIVKKFTLYLKRTILSYCLNLIFILLTIFMLHGREGLQRSEFFPIYSALFLCFFISIVLVIIIRKVLIALQD